MHFIERLRLRIIWSSLGIAHAFRAEASFRQWTWANVVSATLAFLLLDGAELALIVALGLLILVIELINTSIERTVDLISLNRSDLAKQAKETASGAVMLTAIATAVAWLIVLF